MEGSRPGHSTGERLASISTGLVQLHSRYYGKGPTKAKTHLVNDTVICMLRGGFTRVEETLIEEGMPGPVHEGPDIAAEIFVLEPEDPAG
jgi:Na+-translocating membrane potential-generating system (MpsC)